MKKGFLTYQVGGLNDIAFKLEIKNWISGEFDNLLIFDLDNRSETYLATLTSRELMSLDRLAVFIKVYQVGEIGSILSMLGTYARKGKELLIILDGEEELIKKTSRMLAKDNFFCNINFIDQQNIILKFFNK